MEIKYELRNKKKPYYLEHDLIENSDISLKEFEIFDGNSVKWGIKKEYITIKNDQYYNMTPLFENMTDEFGYDKKRIIYLDDSKFVFHGKLNDSEILGKLNGYDDFVTIENFGGKDVIIHESDSEKVDVKFIENGLLKCFYFDCQKFSPCSNTFDAIYVDNTFLKSYQINGRIRLFLGTINSNDYQTKEFGYDVNKQEFINFPLDNDGLIDENEMMDYLKNNYVTGIDIDYYRRAKKLNLISLLIGLGIDGFNVMSKLNEHNKRKIKVR